MESQLVNERDIVARLRSLLATDGKPVTEVPFLDRKIDIVYTTSTGELVAVEAKKSDWKRGLAQAKYCLLGAHKVYLCLPKRVISETMKREFESLGIGLMFLQEGEGSVSILEEIKAEPSQLLWEPYRAMLLASYYETRKHQNGQSR